jgi:superfamily I DNA/RNA helicase
MALTTTARTFTPTEQQEAIFDKVKNGSGSLIIMARAGCGKTTTLKEMVPMLRGRVYVGAFNKAIATELQEKIGNRPGVEVGTMHSLGMRLMRAVNAQFRVEGRKVRSLGRKYYPSNLPDHKKALDVVVDAVSYAKQAGLGLPGTPDPQEEAPWCGLLDYYGLDLEIPKDIGKSEIVRVCQNIYQQSLNLCVQKKDAVIDFDDMILAPLYFSHVVNGKDNAGMYDWFLLDEAQDTNLTRRELAKFVLKPEGRLVAVGDDRQAIYGFAGANNDSMDLIRREHNAEVLPLSVTYRCPRKVVELANTWVEDIQAHESAPEGEVREIRHREFLNMWQDFLPSDAILCRNTRPLVCLARRFRQKGVRCVVEGINYRGLISLASRWGDSITVAMLRDRLTEYVALETENLIRKGEESRAAQLQERRDIILDFCTDVADDAMVYTLLDRMESVLNAAEDSDREPVLTLCTIHRSKGREWNRVFLVGRNAYMPSRYAEKEWELEQEDNLAYVAVTRAKRELVEVVVPVRERGEAPWWED